MLGMTFVAKAIFNTLNNSTALYRDIHKLARAFELQQDAPPNCPPLELRALWTCVYLVPRVEVL
jgi:hypothetical protein